MEETTEVPKFIDPRSSRSQWSGGPPFPSRGWTRRRRHLPAARSAAMGRDAWFQFGCSLPGWPASCDAAEGDGGGIYQVNGNGIVQHVTNRYRRPHTTLDGAVPERIHAGQHWQKPARTAKAVPAHIERCFFPETRVTAFRLANAA